MTIESLFNKVLRIGEQEANILCKTQDNLSEYLNDTALFSHDKNVPIKNITASIDYDNCIPKSDLLITHHPIGKAQYAYPKTFNLYRYFLQHKDKLVDIGIQRLKAYSNDVNAFLYSENQAIICVHTIADICANNFLSNMVSDFTDKTIEELCDTLSSIPAIKLYSDDNLLPYIANGKATDKCGKTFVDMLNGIVEVPEYLSLFKREKIKTAITMHITQDFLKAAKKNKINVINIGHITADNLGMNLLIDKLDIEKSIISISCYGGFKRVMQN